MAKTRICTQCGGDLVVMGTLGTLLHTQCRACGMWHSHRKRQRKRPFLGRRQHTLN